MSHIHEILRCKLLRMTWVRERLRVRISSQQYDEMGQAAPNPFYRSSEDIASSHYQAANAIPRGNYGAVGFIRLVSRVTAPFRAQALPFNVAPVLMVILAKASIIP